MLIIDDQYDNYIEDNSGLEEANLDSEKFIEMWVKYIPYPLSNELESELTPRMFNRYIKIYTEKLKQYARSKTGGMYTIYYELDNDDNGFFNINKFIKYYNDKINIPSVSKFANNTNWIKYINKIKNVEMSETEISQLINNKSNFDKYSIFFKEFITYFGPCVTEAPCGKFELCLLYNTIIRKGKEKNLNYDE